ncbi:glycosyltransferase family 61 protein [Chitinophaga agrisoli]|uniref:Glycosyltransferase family 61 protein n=1 Tax=Chitinophaga agrisoli TaxID=2607653 RepID=A0A5B2W1R1_9BACT|nr:glycosyltransferase family 61 protein [Chitinophaga agrisoli]KAA2244710.1 glycosyltransferase family 61 protein [Chitinophaga agrisoli]
MSQELTFTVQRALPVNLTPADQPLFEQAFSLSLPPAGVQVVENAVILKDTIFSPGTLKFYITASHILPFTRQQALKRLSYYLRPFWRTAQAIWITDEWSAEYFHWMTDALTRLMAARLQGYNYPVVLPAHFRERPYITASLEMLGYSAVYLERKRPLKAASLVVPDHTAPTGNYNPALLGELRRLFAPATTVQPYRKVYVSRQRANRRRVLNEDTLLPVLQQAGFEIHCFEDYSLQEQRAIMQETKVLAGLHGAGLTNMLFMPAGGQVLEIRNMGDTHNNCFFSMAGALGHAYYYVLADGTTADTYAADFRVDAGMLASVVKEMGK